MTPRVHLPGRPFAVGEPLPLDDDVAHHLLRVLRLGPGARIVGFDGEGRSADATLVSTRPPLARVDALRPDEPAALPITLAQCVSTADKMDWTIEKAVELGVTRIVPLTSARAVVRLDDKRRASRDAHWRRIIVAAAAQSGRSRLPVLEPATALADWLAAEPLSAGAHGGGHGWLLDPQAGRSLTEALTELSSGAPAEATGRPAAAGGHRLLCGPEAGLTSDEIEAARRHGWTGVRLGPRILRTETAGLAAIAVIQALVGDYSGR